MNVTWILLIFIVVGWVYMNLCVYIYIYMLFLIKLWMVYGCKRMFISQIDGIIKCIS